MKHSRRKSVPHFFGGPKHAKKGYRILSMLCILAVSGLLAVLLRSWGAMPVKALDVPANYGDGYEITNLTSLAKDGVFKGIRCVDPVAKSYLLTFTDGGDNGLVTLARISQNDSLAEYTFEIALGAMVKLDINYAGSSPLLDGSFFGIGSDSNPFKGTIVIGGAADTAVSVGTNGWRYFFNNLSNEGRIISGAGGYRLYSSYDNTVEESTPQNSNSFALCRVLTVTGDKGELDISGFRFGAKEGTGNTGSFVRSDSVTALFAGTVKSSGPATKFTVDLSNSLTSGVYVVQSNSDDAAGLIGKIDTGVEATVKLPDSFTCNVTSGSGEVNAGILVGSNHGTLTFSRGQNSTSVDPDPVKFSGILNSTGSAGLIGANQEGSTAEFTEDISVDGMKAVGLRAGGIAGTLKGSITLKNAEVKNSEFSKAAVSKEGRLGGAVGSVDNSEAELTVNDGCTLKLDNNKISSDSTYYAGGYIGYLNSCGENLNRVILDNTTISGSGSSSDKIGGWIGYLNIQSGLSDAVEFSVNLGQTGTETSDFTFNNIKGGNCGGVIGEVTAELKHTVNIFGVGTSAVAVRSKFDNSGGSVGGIVGKSTGYVKIHDLSVHNKINKNVGAADIAGVVTENSVLDISGITVTEDDKSVLVAETKFGSAVRFGGTVTNNSSNVNNIVYKQDRSLIYLDDGATYIGNTSVNNDIGNYGQIVRDDTLGNIISINSTTHKAEIAAPLAVGDAVTVSGAADFAKLAITYHTQGAISGVSGIDNSNYSELLGKNINLTADVSLAGTGIEQLTPSNSVNSPYSGTFNGGGHKITLAIGQNIKGEDYGVKAGENDQRISLGLFAFLNNATVKNLTVDGIVNTVPMTSSSSSDQMVYIASLAGKATGELALEDCVVDTNITVSDFGYVKTKNLYLGGAVGCADTLNKLSVTGCTLGAAIQDNYSKEITNNYDKYYAGGFCGYVNYNGTGNMTFTGNTIKTKLTKAGASHEYLMTGGFIGVLKSANYVVADFTGTTAVDVQITETGAKNSAGGMLGYSFEKCHVILGSPFVGTVDAGSAELGGLIHSLSGRMTVNNGFALSGSTLASGAEIRGMLLCDGTAALVTVNTPSTAFTGVTANDFDLFVGKNIIDRTTVDVAASGGIVTVETGDGLGKLPGDGSSWYDLMEARPNDKTRYYFNIAGFENAAGIFDTEEVVKTPAELVYWNVYDYAENALIAEVKSEFFKKAVNSFTAAADIDMTGYCFYPTEKGAVTVDFGGYTLTFGVPAKPSAVNQFLGLQAGLFSDIHSVDSNINATISNIKTDGTVSLLKNGYGSGALICGTVYGKQSGDNRYYVNLSVSGIVLDGLRVEVGEPYRPMLVNRFGSYVNATVSGISQTDSKYEADKNAASSLFGEGGYLEGTTPSSNIKLTLVNIILDGKKGSTIFTDATLFYDVNYAAGTGSFVYNFNLGEDWDGAGNHLQNVTYGVELTLNEDQKQYFDQNIYVRPDVKPTESSAEYDFRGYIPYVRMKDGEINLLLSVNRKVADLLEGFGTYRHPYIISSSKQLEFVSTLLSSGTTTSFPDGWSINFPQGDWSSVSSLNLTDYFAVQASGNKLYKAGGTTTELSKEVLLQYLSGAYYKLEYGTNLTLSKTYAGLGSATYPFHGVIHGNGGVVTMPNITDGIGNAGFGFIKVANGCAVYDLTVKYGTVVLSNDEINLDSGTVTSGPNDSNLMTSLPHFGGVVAWVVGGDNLLDGVRVDTASATVNHGASHTVCGGYVGIVSAGGVLLDNIGETSGVFSSTEHLYNNNYVGRVLNGYVLALDGKTYDNGKEMAGVGTWSNFVIPSVSKDIFGTHKKGYSDGTFTVETEQDLLFLSFGMNSGAFSANSNRYAYGMTSLSRFGEYADVGNTEWDDANWASVVTDGKYKDDSNKLSLMASYFGVPAATDLQNISLTIVLTAESYDLSSYGNAMRAISGANDKSPKYKITSFGKDDGKAVISLNMDMVQYARKKTLADGTTEVWYYDEMDTVYCYGLFGSLSSNVTFKNVELHGKVSLQRLTPENTPIVTDRFSGENKNTPGDFRTVGGLLGLAGANVNIQNAALNNITVASPDMAGGFVGFFSGTTFNLNNPESGFDSDNATVKGKRHVGGAVGFANSGTLTVNGFRLENSIVETRTATKQGSSAGIGTGGVVGGISGGNGLTVKEAVIKKTAIVFYANFKTTSDKIGSGGLVGWTNKPVTAESCTIDGCVIYSLSNFSGGNFPYQGITVSEEILPADLRANIVYNGEYQNSAKVLASMLYRNNGVDNYASNTAGGLIGASISGGTFTGCTVTSSAAPSVIAAHNGAAGLIGENRGFTGTMNVTDCTVSSGVHDMYILSATRSAGIVAYHSGSAAKYVVNNMQVVGSEEKPVRFIQFEYKSTEAAGLFGDLGPMEKVQVHNSQVSNCIISGAKASGIYCTVTSTTKNTVDLKNVHVQNNLIFTKNSYYAGGLLGDNASANTTVAIDGAYVGNNYILSVGKAAGIIGGLTNGTVTADYLIMDDNVIGRFTGSGITNYTFAAGSMNEAVGKFTGISSDANNTGLIAANNSSGTITAIPVCVNYESTAKELIVPQNIGTDNGKNTVVFAANGAQNVYTRSEAITDGKTPQQIAIEKMSGTYATNAGSTVFYGDSITDGTPIKLDGLTWFPFNGRDMGSATLSKLSDKMKGITENGELQLVCLTEKTNETMQKYLNLLTGGGFENANGANLVDVTVTSERYSVGKIDGRLTLIGGSQGSVVYDEGTFKVGAYDNLDSGEDENTLTVLTVSFGDRYTMHLAIYYARSVNLKAFVVPVEGEQYYIPAFILPSEPVSTSLEASVSFGNPFTLYVEYDYDSMIKGIAEDDPSCFFKKQIELTQSDGKPDESAKIEAGTSLVLIDLNSKTPQGYSYYTKTLTSDSRFISFDGFTSPEDFSHIPLSALEGIALPSDDRVCKDTDPNTGCIYTERYLLVVSPVQNNTDKAMKYTMKAVIDEEQRKALGIVVKSQSNVLGQVSVWKSPDVQTAGSYIDGKNEFSSLADDPILMNVDTKVTFPEGFISALRGTVYGTHIISLQDSAKNYVELPLGTEITVTADGGDELYSKKLTSPTSQIRIPMGDLLKNGAVENAVETKYSIKLDFSGVNITEYNDAFIRAVGNKFTLVDSFYLSGDATLLGSGPFNASQEYTIKLDNTVKLAVVPDDNRYLGINLQSPEDETNSGIIDFTVSANFDSFADKVFKEATLEFSVSKKIYNSERGVYEYVPASETEKIPAWRVEKNGVSITSDTIALNNNEGSGDYCLKVDLKDNPDLTNYRLTVVLNATATDGTPVPTASEYFVFLICDLNVRTD